MTAGDLLAALGLPPEAMVDQRIPKKLLSESGAQTAADGRLIEKGIGELRWLAVLKPTTIGVAPFADATREYLEIAVLGLRLGKQVKAERLEELVHRAVPYPVVLITEQDSLLSMSLAHKRWSQNEVGATVLDGGIIDACIECAESPVVSDFAESLNLVRQERSTMYTLYQSWINVMLALRAAQITGSYTVVASPEQAEARQKALQTCAYLQERMKQLRTAARKEKQLQRLAALNLELKRMQEEYVAARKQL